MENIMSNLIDFEPGRSEKGIDFFKNRDQYLIHKKYVERLHLKLVPKEVVKENVLYNNNRPPSALKPKVKTPSE